jgi:hypothetical protein
MGGSIPTSSEFGKQYPITPSVKIKIRFPEWTKYSKTQQSHPKIRGRRKSGSILLVGN